MSMRDQDQDDGTTLTGDVLAQLGKHQKTVDRITIKSG